MHIRAACQDGKSLVGRITANVCTQIDWMGRFGEKLKICTVSVVNGKDHTVGTADLGYSADVRYVSEIVGGGDVYCRRLFLIRRKYRVQQIGIYGAGKI